MGKVRNRIKNLSIRKALFLYTAVSLFCSFLLSAYIIVLANRTQAGIWRNYGKQDEFAPEKTEIAPAAEDVQQGKYDPPAEAAAPPPAANVERPVLSRMTPHDRLASEICDFLQTYTMLLLPITGCCCAVFLFYRKKLKYPLAELMLASKNIAENNLQFHVIYESKDELGELCREFERMRARLAENNILLWRSLEEERALRAAIAHDIRSPLSVLKGYQEMLTDYLPNESISLEKAMEMLHECGKQLERMDKFVETMRKLSSLEQRELCPETLTAGQLEADLLAEISILEKEAGKRILLHTASTEDVFRGDRDIILEVTENLLSNALRYARTEVEITLSLSVGECRICVTDDGTGFSAKADESAKDSLKHAGLGMYISRLYCEKHGGRLLSGNLQQGGASVTAVFASIAFLL
ncbi:MAG: HAMP domain-containing histidine kinase [Butyrivibrio sp.]|nr:HAMP domain-containing histidine kinase [Acetatifactor muris]MCM1559526.1 HAMP domain-containing histidine kinase [Butyrivibrio sp.]